MVDYARKMRGTGGGTSYHCGRVLWSALVVVFVYLFVSMLTFEWGHSSLGAVPCPTTSFLAWNRPEKAAPTLLPADLAFLCNDPAISFLRILDPPPLRPSSTSYRESSGSKSMSMFRPKILCLVLTQYPSHSTRLEAILDTWGRKCDAFIAASDADDPPRHALKIKSQEGYWGIWDKLMQTLRLVLLNPNLDDFDWILKADDDTYIIMENLQTFLSNVTNLSSPLIYGRVMPWPKLGELAEFRGWWVTPKDKAFQKRFFAKFPDLNQKLHYAHGGPGYIMNRNYVEILTKAYFESPDAVTGRLSEDLGNAFTMLYRNITPQSTMDWETGKERSHPESPRTMYSNPKWLPWVQEAIQHRGTGAECCSPTTISYHHVHHHEMRLLDYQLYTCPRVVAP